MYFCVQVCSGEYQRYLECASGKEEDTVEK